MEEALGFGRGSSIAFGGSGKGERRKKQEEEKQDEQFKIHRPGDHSNQGDSNNDEQATTTTQWTSPPLAPVGHLPPSSVRDVYLLVFVYTVAEVVMCIRGAPTFERQVHYLYSEPP